MSVDGPFKGGIGVENEKNLFGNENVDINLNYDDQQQQMNYDDEENIILPGVDDLPIFATPEAIKQQQEQEKRVDLINKIEVEVSDLEDRLRVMREHSKNVAQELDHTNALFNAKKSEIHAEEHMRQLAARQLGRSKSDSRKVQQDIELTQEQLNMVQNLIYKA